MALSRLTALLRGLRSRAGLSAMTFVVATVAAAAGTMGPVYEEAARTSILRDELTSAPITAQGLELSDVGMLAGLSAHLGAIVDLTVEGTAADRLLPRRVAGLESREAVPGTEQQTVLAWRDGACDQLQLVSGRCPSKPREVMASEELARLDHWRVGQSLPLGGRLVGVYRVPDPDAVYWFARGYFPQQARSTVSSSGGSNAVDALFTTEESMEDATSGYSGTAVVDLLVDPSTLQGDDVGQLRDAVDAISRRASDYPTETPPSVVSGLPTVVDRVQESWRGLLTPTVLITGQLLVVSWLMLFLTVGEATEARAPEVALAKLRGFGRSQTLGFGLSEVLLLLVAALPAGAVLGWGGAVLLGGHVLRPGTPVPLPGAGWAGAGAAALGGVVATVLAARRTLARPVLEQWRRTARPARRGWVVDTLVATAAAAGVVELVLGGSIAAPGQHVLALLCPGLLAVAVAVSASRLLPAGCRAVHGWSLRHGGIAPFLAVRQIARRPGGTRTTIVLVAAFALTTFALAADTVVRGNLARVAAAEVGAATVLTVVPPAGQRTADIVDRLDPSGTQAVAVREHVDLGTPPRALFAVDPARFARIAAWPDGRPADLEAQLRPPTPSPIVLEGDRVRVHLVVGAATRGDGTRLSLRVQSDSAYRETPVDLGPVVKGSRTLEGPLPSCPCTLRGISASGAAGRDAHVLVAGIDVRSPHGWTALDAGLTTGRGWRWQQSDDLPPEVAEPTARGLRLTFRLSDTLPPAALYSSWPDPVPALIASGSLDAGSDSPPTVTGLAGTSLAVSPAVTGTVPGDPVNGVVVDLDNAERAAGGLTPNVQDEVWLTAAASASMTGRLRDAGVGVTATRTTGERTATFLREGPALAVVLLLADAVAAAVLAAAGAVVALHLSARRRTYELAALRAVGATRRDLSRALRLEQLLTLGFGVVLGVATGWASALLALPSVPELVDPPAAPSLSFVPPVGPVLVPLVVGVLLIAVSAELSRATLLRRLRTDALREGPS